MADNVDVTPGTGATIATDDVSGAQYQRVKVDLGGDGVASPLVRGQQNAAGSLPVVLASDTGAVPVTGTFWQATQPVSGTFWQTTQPVSGTFWQTTQPVSAVSLPLPSGAATAAKQPALGTAGSASSDVLTVQGVASMTALKVDASSVAVPITDNSGSLTVDGSVTANAGTNLNTSALALETGGNLATLAGAVSSSKVAVKSASGDLADGALVTLGTKADAKSTATDTTAVTAMQVLKQISASVQAPPSQAVTNAGTFAVQASAGTNLNTSLLALETGGNLATIAGAVSSSKVATKAAAADFADGAIATLGLKADAKNSASDTTSMTIMSVLKQVSFSMQAAAASVAGTLTVASHAVTNAGTFAVQAALSAGSNLIGSVDHSTTGTADGHKEVTTAGTRVVLAASTAAKWATIQAYRLNTGFIGVGGTTVLASATIGTGTGVQLAPGDSITLPCDNLTDINIDSTVNGEGVRYVYGT